MGGVTESEKEQLFWEHVEWYRLYDLSMRPVPESWDSFKAYWNHMCTHVLEDHRAARDVLDLRGVERPRHFQRIPRFVWTGSWELCARALMWITTGLYEPVIRQRLGLTWTERDERWHRRVGWLVHHGFMYVPRSRRYHPRARAGRRRANGQNAPLVETPDRNLPKSTALPRNRRAGSSGVSGGSGCFLHRKRRGRSESEGRRPSAAPAPKGGAEQKGP